MFMINPPPLILDLTTEMSPNNGLNFTNLKIDEVKDQDVGLKNTNMEDGAKPSHTCFSRHLLK